MGTKISKKFGVAASSLQVAGTFFHTRVIPLGPLYRWVPMVVGMIFYILAGICWTLEMLTSDEPPKKNSHYWPSISARGATAGILATITGAIIVTSLYVSAPALFWVISALTIVEAVIWYHTDIPENPKTQSVSQEFNRIAAGAQIVSALLFVAAFLCPPAIGATLGFIAIGFAFLSATVWLGSYLITDEEPLNVDSTMPPLQEKTGSSGLTHSATQGIHNSYGLRPSQTHAGNPTKAATLTI